MAGIFHFVSASSLQDFARALEVALPGGHSQHDESELLILDRADLALRRHGWCLGLSRRAGDALLTLRRIDHQATFTSPAPATAPAVVHEVRAPRLQARLEQLLGDAPLEIVQRWQVRGLRHACVNEDDKIECTLIAATYRAVGADTAAAPLLVELVPKRGYERETAALAARLALPWRRLEHDYLHLLDDLYTVRLESLRPPRSRHDRAPVALAQVLLDQHALACACVEPGGTAPGVDELHDFRVAMRRSRSLLRGFRHCLGRDLDRHFSAEFRWLSRATSRLRDIDVLLLAMQAPSADYAALCEAQRARIATLLEHERARAARRLVKVLASARYARLRRAWPAALLALLHHPSRQAPRVAPAASQAIAKALARVRRDVTVVENDYSAASLHELRKQCKRLRYLIEPFAALYPRQRITAFEAELKRLQTMMGEICDRHAQLALLKGSLKTRAAGDAALGAALAAARRQLRLALAASDVEAVLGALADFDSSRHHAALDSLFQTAES
jgi:CHAD domain-containing protein